MGEGTNEVAATQRLDRGAADAALIDQTPEMVAVNEQLARTRADMGRTIDAIQEKLAPESIIQQAKDAAADAIQQAKDAVQTTATDTIQTFESKVQPEELIRHAKEAAKEVTQDAIESIHQKISPKALIREAREAVAETAQDVSTGLSQAARGASMTLMESIRENPVPAAIAGLGLGWLYMSARRQSGAAISGAVHPVDGRQSYGGGAGYSGSQISAPGNGSNHGGTLGQIQDRAGQVVDRVQDKVGQVAGQAKDAASQVADRVGTAASQVSDRVTDMAGQVQDRAGDMVDQVQSGVRQLGDQAQDTTQWAVGEFNWALDRSPLAVAAVAAALGVAVGMIVPETRKERQIMGPTRDQLIDRAQDAVQDLGQKAQSIATEVVNTVTEEAKNQGIVDHVQGAGQGLVEKVQNVASEAVDAAKEEAAHQGLSMSPIKV